MINEDIEKLLTAKGVTATPMRILVLEYLLGQSAAVSLQDLERDFQHSDRTTLYRTLRTFEEKGLIHPIKDGTEATRYALCNETCKEGTHFDGHLHFYCYSCRQTVCLPQHRVPEVDLPQAFVLKELSLVAKGICGPCSQKQCNPVA